MPSGACLAAEADPRDTAPIFQATVLRVKNFDLAEPVLSALETSLSPERFARYLSAVDGRRVEAMRLYTWNTALSAAFYGPLQGLEIALRNALHRELTATYGSEWYNNAAAKLSAATKQKISEAARELTQRGYPSDTPHIVANLSFGFWVSLLGKGGGDRSDHRRSSYDMTLWRPALYRAFPAFRGARKDIHRRFDYLRTFRNRIAHHEPIFERDLRADFASILTATGWIDEHTRNWISHHSRVPELLELSREDAARRF